MPVEDWFFLLDFLTGVKGKASLAGDARLSATTYIFFSVYIYERACTNVQLVNLHPLLLFNNRTLDSDQPLQYTPNLHPMILLASFHEPRILTSMSKRKRSRRQAPQNMEYLEGTLLD